MDWIDLVRDKGPVQGAFEHDNVLTGSKTRKEIPEYLQSWRPLKKGLSAWTSQIVN